MEDGRRCSFIDHMNVSILSKSILNKATMSTLVPILANWEK